MKTYRQNNRKQLRNRTKSNRTKSNRTKSNRTKSNRKHVGGIGGDLFCKSERLMEYINGMIYIINNHNRITYNYIVEVETNMIELSSKPEKYLQKIRCTLKKITDNTSKDSYITLMIYQRLINLIINGIESDINAKMNHNDTLQHTLKYYQKLDIKVDHMIANHKYEDKTTINKLLQKVDTILQEEDNTNINKGVLVKGPPPPPPPDGG